MTPSEIKQLTPDGYGGDFEMTTGGKPMTNYSERLYEIIDKHRHDVDMDFSADIRHYKNTNETVDGITSLIKELVAEAKPEQEFDEYGYCESEYYVGYNAAIAKVEQNLLKALETLE